MYQFAVQTSASSKDVQFHLVVSSKPFVWSKVTSKHLWWLFSFFVAGASVCRRIGESLLSPSDRAQTLKQSLVSLQFTQLSLALAGWCLTFFGIIFVQREIGRNFRFRFGSVFLCSACTFSSFFDCSQFFAWLPYDSISNVGKLSLSTSAHVMWNVKTLWVFMGTWDLEQRPCGLHFVWKNSFCELEWCSIFKRKHEIRPVEFKNFTLVLTINYGQFSATSVRS